MIGDIIFVGLVSIFWILYLTRQRWNPDGSTLDTIEKITGALSVIILWPLTMFYLSISWPEPIHAWRENEGVFFVSQVGIGLAITIWIISWLIYNPNKFSWKHTFWRTIIIVVILFLISIYGPIWKPTKAWVEKQIADYHSARANAPQTEALHRLDTAIKQADEKTKENEEKSVVTETKSEPAPQIVKSDKILLERPSMIYEVKIWAFVNDWYTFRFPNDGKYEAKIHFDGDVEVRNMINEAPVGESDQQGTLGYNKKANQVLRFRSKTGDIQEGTIKYWKVN